MEEEIVISGISGIFPNSANMNELMDNLYNGVNCVNGCRPRWPPGFAGIQKNTGNIPDDLNNFDAEFFGYSESEANSLDCTLRMLLEKTYEAILDSGTNPISLKGSETGFFLGCYAFTSNMVSFVMKDDLRYHPFVTCVQSNINFDFHGPTSHVDTACASSLSALNLAMIALRNGQCNSALVAGIALDIYPGSAKCFMDMKMTSPDSKCKAFDKSADGYGRSEAIVVIFLQKICDAKRVYAKIKNIKSNCDGFKELGITFPRWDTQSSLISKTFEEAGIDPLKVKYIESHTTGTRAGDPVECKAIANSMCKIGSGRRDGPLLLGALKSNIGHTEFASGMAAIAKVIITYQNKCIPRNLHLNELNPDIPELFDGSLKPITENTPFEGGLVSLNNFGFGGANTHLIVESYEKEFEDSSYKINDSIPRLVLICGRTQDSIKFIFNYIIKHFQLKKMTREFLSLIDEISELKRMKYRGSLLLQDDGNYSVSYSENSDRFKNEQIWFLFGNANTLCSETINDLLRIKQFSNTIKNLSNILSPYDIDLLKVFREFKNCNIVESFVTSIAYQIAIIDLLKLIGIKPDGLIGIGSGEISCAYTDGVIDAEQAIMIAYWCAKCIEYEINHGSSNIYANFEKFEAKQKNDSSRFLISSQETSNSVKMNGEQENLSQFSTQTKIQKIAPDIVNDCWIPFKIFGLNNFTETLAIKLKSLKIKPFVRSNNWISTSAMEGSSTDYNHFIKCLIKPVLFQEAMQKISSNSTIVEISPNIIQEKIIKYTSGLNLNYIAINGDSKNLLTGVGKLYEYGFNPQIKELYPKVQFPVPRGTPFISPLIKWDHSKKWFTPNYLDQVEKIDKSKQILKVKLTDPEYECIKGHIIDGKIIFPASGYLYLAWKSIAAFYHNSMYSLPIIFENVEFKKVTFVSMDNEICFEFHYFKETNTFHLTESNSICVSGHVAISQDEENFLKFTDILMEHLDEFEKTEENWLDSKGFYRELKIRGYDYGEEFQGVHCTNFDGNLSKVFWNGNWITFIDSLFQTGILGLTRKSLVIPTSIQMIRWDPRKFDNKEKKILNVVYEKNMRISVTDCFEASGLKTSRISRHNASNVILERYEFIPNNFVLKNNLSSEVKSYIDSCENLANYIEKSDDKESLDANYDFESFLYNDESKRKGSRYDLINLLHIIYQKLKTKHDCQDKEKIILENNLELHKDLVSNELLCDRDFIIFTIDILVRNNSYKYEDLKLLEINMGGNILIENFQRSIKEYSCTSNVKILHIDKNMLPEEICQLFSIDQLNYKENKVESFIKPSSQDFVIYRDPTTCLSFNYPQEFDSLKMLESIYSILSINGFLLTYIRAKRLAFDKFLFGKEYDFERNFELFSEKANELGFRKISISFDSYTTYGILWRKIDPNYKMKKHVVVDLTCQNYLWINEIKDILLKGSEFDRIWLVSNEKINGVFGLANSLQKEPHGEKIKSYITDQKIDSIPESIIEKDLCQNIYLDGKYGQIRPIRINKDSIKRKVENACICLETKGDLSSFNWYESSLPIYTQKGKIPITVYYTGLNFRDIMFATGRIQGDKFSNIGLEFSGIDQNGNRIMGFLDDGALATNLIVDDINSTWSIPDDWTLEEAATIPVVYATCYYALEIRGKLKPKEKVLIHSGSGGVGYAALRICSSMDCDIFTTVGSEEKKQFLLKEFPKLKPKQIFNSRDTRFEADILNITDGYGVDVILNSLSGDKLLSSVKCLAKNGRFCEIGKYDMMINSQLDLSLIGENKTFHGILLDALNKTEEEEKSILKQKKLINDLLKIGIVNGVVKPLPRTVFDRDNVEKAFRYMSSGKHKGKVLIKMRDENSIKPEKLFVLANTRIFFKQNKSIIITGGLGGFGLELIQFFADRGAKNIVIVSRSGLKTSYQRYVFNRLEKQGINLIIWKGQACKEEDVLDIISSAQKLGDIEGIFHLAMILKDRIFTNLTIEEFSEVAETKYLMAKYFDKLTRKVCPNLEYFVVFSSVTSQIGNRGQSNYGYANSLCDKICESRRKDGLHGLAIQWGIIGDVGYVEENVKDKNVLDLSAQRIPSCLSTLDSIIKSDYPVISSRIPKGEEKKCKSGSDLWTNIKNIMGIENDERLDHKTRLLDLGIDSLMAVEIKFLIEKDFQKTLQNDEIINLTIYDILCIQSKIEHYSNKSNPVKKIPELSLKEKENLNLVKSELGNINVNLAYCFPSLGDHFGKMRSLAEKLNFPIIALNWTQNFNSFSSIDEITNKWVEVILEDSNTNEDNGINLIGYSFGGLAAFETAIKLQKQNKKIKHLILFDSTPVNEFIDRLFFDYGKIYDISDKSSESLEIIINFVTTYIAIDYITFKNQLLNLENDEKKIEFAFNCFVENGFDLNKEEFKSCIQSHFTMLEMLKNYKFSQKFIGDAMLIRANKSKVPDSHEKGVNEDYGLSKVITGNCEVISLEGNHLNYISNNLEKISRIINEKFCCNTIGN